MPSIKQGDKVENLVDSSFAEAMEYMARPILDVLRNHKTDPVKIDTLAVETDYTTDDIIGIVEYLSQQHLIKVIQPAGGTQAMEVALTSKGLKSL